MVKIQSYHLLNSLERSSHTDMQETPRCFINYMHSYSLPVVAIFSFWDIPNEWKLPLVTVSLRRLHCADKQKHKFPEILLKLKSLTKQEQLLFTSQFASKSYTRQEKWNSNAKCRKTSTLQLCRSLVNKTSFSSHDTCLQPAWNRM